MTPVADSKPTSEPAPVVRIAFGAVTKGKSAIVVADRSEACSDQLWKMVPWTSSPYKGGPGKILE